MSSFQVASGPRAADIENSRRKESTAGSWALVAPRDDLPTAPSISKLKFEL